MVLWKFPSLLLLTMIHLVFLMIQHRMEINREMQGLIVP